LGFGVGTVARIASVEITEGSIVLLATGAARFEVVRWLADDPFPRALVRELDGFELDAPTVSALAAAEALVRATIGQGERVRRASLVSRRCVVRRASRPNASGRLPASHRSARWISSRCCARGPATELLARLVEETQAADARFTARWADDGQDDGDFPQ